MWALPSGDRGAQIEIPGNLAVEWQPGEKQAWRPVLNPDLVEEAQLRAVTNGLTAVATVGTTVYEGISDGSIVVYNNGVRLQFSPQNSGTVERFWVDPADSKIAIAVLGARPENAIPGIPAVHVLHTVDAGANWDPLISNLPDVAVHGVAVSRPSGAIYIATDAGVYFMKTDVSVLSFPGQWQRVEGLPPQAPVMDVRLDLGDTQLWAAVQGYGVYSALAPHRLGDPRVVSAADQVAQAAAPVP